MLTFLRKIRRSLIESGSARKYILYAIGEIALVVIGILIALQINNWNTEQKEKQITNAFLRTIQFNIKEDLEHVKNLKDQRDTLIVWSIQCLQAIQNNDIGGLGVNIDMLNIQLNWAAVNNTKLNKGGFESLKSSGYLVRIQETQIEGLLNEYYRTEDLINDYEDNLNIWTTELKLSSRNSDSYRKEFNFTWRKFVNLESISREELHTMNYDRLNHPATLMLYGRTAGTSGLSNLYGKLINLGEEIISAIDDSPNNKE